MDEVELNEAQLLEERKDILKEIGPTYYDLTGIPTGDKEAQEFINKELKEIEEAIENAKENEKGYSESAINIIIQKYNQYKIILEKIDSLRKSQQDIISQIALYKKGICMTEKSMLRRKIESEKAGENNSSVISKIQAEISDIDKEMEMLSILGSTEKKAKYDAELEKKIEEEREKRKKERLAKLEKEKREKLKKNRTLRKITEKEEIEQELGDNVVLDRSNEKYKEDDYSFETSENPLAKWKVELYPEKQLLFSTNTNNRKYPELNQKVNVYRYGTFEFQTIFNNGKPTKEDKTCEIIGVKKIDIEGNEEENFLIAQTMETAYVKRITVKEILDLRKRGINVSVIENPEDIQRRERKARREKMREERRSNFEKLIIKVKKSIKPEKIEEEKIDLNEEKDALIFDKRVVTLTPDQIEKLSRIYLSDYLIDNAIQNNSRYIGSLRYPGEDIDLEALKVAGYAEKRPGVIIDQRFGNLRTSARNINDVFTIIKNKEKNKSRENKVSMSEDIHGKIIKFPSIDD